MGLRLGPGFGEGTMATRREAREWAVQILFELDLNPSDKLDKVFSCFWVDREPDAKARAFTEELVRGAAEQRDAIDARIQELAENWDVRRIGVLERNVLRLAAYEMLFREDIPPVVSINEAVDIAKYFSNTESGRFVNGILDRMRKDLGRPARSGSKRGARTEGDGGREGD